MYERLSKIVPQLRKNDPIIGSINLLNTPLNDDDVDLLIDSINSNYFISKIVLDKNELSSESAVKFFNLLLTNPTITHLEVSENGLDDETIGKLEEIILKLPKNRDPITLILKNNIFTAKGAKSIANFLSNNSPIFWLDLRNNRNIGDEGVCSIASALTDNTVLYCLDLIKCGCNTLGAAALSESLVVNKTLKTLLLQDSFTDSAIDHLGYMLSSPGCMLQSLYLWECKLESSSINILCDAMKNNNSLTTLALSYNQFKDDAAVPISQMILMNKSLVKLHLGANRFTSTFASFISLGLSKNKTLQYLDLSRNKIRSLGLWPLTVALKNNHTLTSLDLRYNEINQSGAAMIGDIFASNNSLRLIKLSGNLFDNASVVLFARMLIYNKTLKELELNGVHMTTIGFVAICKALKYNKTIEKISLSSNLLSVNAMEEFAELMKVTTTLNSISMSNCNIDDEGCEYIAKGLSYNSSLQYLDISNNNFGDEGMNMIVDALSGNFTLLQIDCINNETMDMESETAKNAQERITDYLERNNYYQHNILMQDLTSLVLDRTLI